MQTITPHLWFDKEAKQAAELYKSIFKDSEIKNRQVRPLLADCSHGYGPDASGQE